jgi:hypothetical protein
MLKKLLNKLLDIFTKEECACTHKGGGVYIQKGDIYCHRCLKRKPSYADLIS